MKAVDEKSNVKVTWFDANGDIDVRNRIQDYFEKNNLNCEKTEYGLYITCNDEDKAYSYMWGCMYDLVHYDWFRNAVKSCVWTDGMETEDVIVSYNEDLTAEKSNTSEDSEEQDEVVLTWANPDTDTEVQGRIKKAFKENHLECKETEDGLRITCNDKNNAYSYMWECMMDLVTCSWFRNAVKSCVYESGMESEDVIITSAKLIAEGKMSIHD